MLNQEDVHTPEIYEDRNVSSIRYSPPYYFIDINKNDLSWILISPWDLEIVQLQILLSPPPRPNLNFTNTNAECQLRDCYLIVRL